MTPEIEDVLESLLINKVPNQWLKVSYPTEKSFSNYLNDFCKRFEWFQTWQQNNKMIWLSAFFQPRRFLTSIKLDFARQHAAKLEEVTLDFEVVNANG